MSTTPGTPWHRESWDRCLDERLPRLLAERMPLGGYRVAPAGEAASCVRITVAGPAGPVEAEYRLPSPDPDGLFHLAGRPHVVVPTADSDNLDTAEVRCAGEQFGAFIDDRLGRAPADLEWDEARLRAWLPLEEWTAEFMRAAQPLDTTNWLSARTHLRRLLLPEDRRPFTPSQFGRVCPLETPEGPNLGRVLTIARGAAIRDGRLVVDEDSPAGGLGLGASAVPFVEHSDVCRLLMAVNMMRQWLTPPDPEPALVQTGGEPDDPAFWCGRSLLTAYVMRGCDTFEDSILISESCARRLGYPEPVQPGDKMSNRSGNKGVISRIVPDDEMPHLQDGTPVELCFSPLSVPSRMTWGQLKEAAISWVARRQGKPVVVPSFGAPDRAELQRLLADAGVPETGQQVLLDRKGGEPMPLPSTVGWVYWGKLVHRSGPKLHATTGTMRSQRVGEPEAHALLHAGAAETVRELFNTRAAGRPDADTLAERAAQGPLTQSDAPSPGFARLQRRLLAAGVMADLGDAGVRFAPADPGEEAVTLAQPVSHPWLPGAALERVGAVPELAEWAPLREANARLARMLERGAPESLRSQTVDTLAGRAVAYLDALVDRESVELSARATFSGHAVATPDCSLHYDQVGLPESMAWTLFGPMAARAVGSQEASERTPAARAALEAAMARSWVLLARVVVCPAPFVAFRPVLTADPALRIHPFTCRLLNADFDGDEPIVHLPVTEAGQREAAEKLTIEAHVARELQSTRRMRPLLDAQFGPFLYNVRPTQESRFGLAWLARTAEGHAELERLAGVPIPLHGGVLNGDSLLSAQVALLEQGGVRAMLDAMHRLTVRGYEACRTPGASFSPFESAGVEAPVPPVSDNPDAWDAYREEYKARIAARFDDPATNDDPAKLTLCSGARATLHQWVQVVGVKGIVRGIGDTLVPVKHGVVEGLTPDEVYLCTIGMREGIARAMSDFFSMQREIIEAEPPSGYGVLARAMRARRPGVVFARAAAAHEVDPLKDPQSRLFVGLSV